MTKIFALIAASVALIFQATALPQATTTCTASAVIEGFTISGYTQVTPAPTVTATAYRADPTWSSAHVVRDYTFAGGADGYCDYKCQYNDEGNDDTEPPSFMAIQGTGGCRCIGFDAELTPDLLVPAVGNDTAVGRAYDEVC